jgi:hypothetical protein
VDKVMQIDMRIDFDAVLIDVDVLRESIRGVKVELSRKRTLIYNISTAKRTTAVLHDAQKFYSRGSEVARKIIRLEAIIKELEALLKLSEYNELKIESIKKEEP